MNDVLIIGGGPAGLLTAYHLKRFGVDAIVFEKGQAGQSWREMKDQMTMLSPAVAAHDLTSLSFDLPIWSMIPLQGPFAQKEEFVAYIEAFVKSAAINIREGKSVSSIERTVNGFFRVHFDDGISIESKFVVIATGVIGAPFIPAISGVENNPHVIHSKRYAGLKSCRGKKILVVGAGNSGVELTIEMAGNADVTLASWEKLKFFSSTGNLSHIRGQYESLLKELIRFKIIRLKECVTLNDISGPCVTFSDGASADFDLIIFATGYRPYLPQFIGMNIDLDSNGYPKVSANCECSGVKSLYFTGPLAHTRKCSFIHCFRPKVEPMALHIAENLDI